MNNCHAPNGTCNPVTGQCECTEGWKFADCGVATVDLTSGYTDTKNGKGPVWYSYTYKGDPTGTKTSTFGLALNNIGSDVYVSKGNKSDPNNFNYDMSFKNVTSINLSSADIKLLNDTDGYSVSVYVPAIDEATNNLLDLSIVVKFEESTGAAALLAAGIASSFLALF